MSRTTVYVGNLPNDTKEREVEELFDKYGRIRDIDLKLPGRPPAFAFVEFDDARDAADAVKYRDGYDFGGCRLRVPFLASMFHLLLLVSMLWCASMQIATFALKIPDALVALIWQLPTCFCVRHSENVSCLLLCQAQGKCGMLASLGAGVASAMQQLLW